VRPRALTPRCARPYPATVTIEHLRRIPTEHPFVSSGDLPSPGDLQAEVDEAHRRFADEHDGEVSTGYEALARMSPERFGVCVVTTTGRTYGAGDIAVPFAVMSVAKAFTFAVVCDALGRDAVRDAVGVNATGLPFNLLTPRERRPDGRTNPMVNPGAIAVAGLVPGGSVGERWALLSDRLSAFAGRALALDDEVYESARMANFRNRGIAWLLHSYGGLAASPADTIDLYTRQSCLAVTAEDLAVMGATLADGGVNPRTGEQVVGAESCRCALVVMATAGMYETSGDWLYDVGLPGKSGIGGGIVTISPGKGGLGTFSPRLDEAGNSVRGQLAARFLSQRLGLDLFASVPAV
jgi:glutaminase